MMKIKSIALLGFCILILLCSLKAEAKAEKKVKPKVVKVTVVIQDPVVNGKRIHETFKTPGYSFKWNDPWQLTKDYKRTL